MATLENTIPAPGNPVLNNTEQVNTSKVPESETRVQEKAGKAVSGSGHTSDVETGAGATQQQSKTNKLTSFFGLGKKKEDDKLKKKKQPGGVERKEGETSESKMEMPSESTVSKRATKQTPPPVKNHPYNLPASPHRNLFSSSPRPASPAGSQIFERDVLDSVPSLPIPSTIPAHIQTEDHIPAVLDASSEAITNENLDPDSVEIVMHAAHQPAAVTVTGVPSEPSSVWGEESTSHLEDEPATANYASLDSADVRRLSFISFQDIVQSEHAEFANNRDSIYVAGLSTLSSAHNRSPSPIRSPVSSPGLEGSPPASQSASIGGLSPKIRPFGSPSQSSHLGATSNNELTIETMTQALRRTGSGDLSGARSQPLSPSSPTDTHPALR